MSKSDDNRATRSTQILDAAAKCFSKRGIAGANMDLIAKTAKMSVGHVYHYYPSKRAIVIALFQRTEDANLAAFARRMKKRDLAENLESELRAYIDTVFEPRNATLALAILAEAAHDRELGEVVRAADQKLFAAALQLIEARATRRGDDAGSLSMRAEIVATLMDGLTMRAIRKPDVDRGELVTMIVKTLNLILGPPAVIDFDSP